MRRVVHIFALLSLLVYCAPLRACVIQQWTTGTSCHDADHTPVHENESGGGALHSDQGHEGCVCGQPKSSANRSHLFDTSFDFISPLASELVHLDPAPVERAAEQEAEPPERPPLSWSLPLIL